MYFLGFCGPQKGYEPRRFANELRDSTQYSDHKLDSDHCARAGFSDFSYLHGTLKSHCQIEWSHAIVHHLTVHEIVAHDRTQTQLLRIE